MLDATVVEPYLDSWYGSSARAGLDLEWSDSFSDLTCDFSNLTCTVNGKRCDRGQREAVMRGDAAKLTNPIFHYYHKWYGCPTAEAVYENPDGNGKTCLFIEQSYGVAIERPMAENYSRLICTDPLNASVDKTIDELIEEWDADDVVIQFACSGLLGVKDKSPRLFE